MQDTTQDTTQDIQITMTFTLKELMLLRYSLGIERATAEKQMERKPNVADKLNYKRYIKGCRELETRLRDAEYDELRRLGKIK